MSMTIENLKRVRAQTGLTGAAFAHLLRMHDPTGRTVYRWENGETMIPGYVSLICELLQLPEVRRYLARHPFDIDRQRRPARKRKRRSRARLSS